MSTNTKVEMLADELHEDIAGLVRMVEDHRRVSREAAAGYLALEKERDALLAAIPEGCTPADAAVLREANHQLAAECEALALRAAMTHARETMEAVPVPRTWDFATSRHSWVTAQDFDDYRAAVLRALGDEK